MSSFEYSAKNVNKAIENACAELNLSPEEIKYDILSHGSSGIFGLAGVKKAKIRVHLTEKVKAADPESAVFVKTAGLDIVVLGLKHDSRQSFPPRPLFGLVNEGPADAMPSEFDVDCDVLNIGVAIPILIEDDLSGDDPVQVS